MDNIKTRKISDEKIINLLAAWRRYNSVIASIFTVLVIFVFPLVFHDYYCDILVAKYIFYYDSVILMVVTILVGVFFFWYRDEHEIGGNVVREMRSNTKLNALKMSDWAMIIFLIAVTMSTSQSEYRFESFWGNEGRYMGMFLILLYGVSFFVISRCLRCRQRYLDAFLAGGIITCMIGTLRFFKINPVGFKRGLVGDDYTIFAPTIGNVDTCTSYVAMVSGMGIIVFSMGKNKYRRLWYLVVAILPLSALIVGISDSVYLALFVFFELPPFYLFGNIDGVKRYMLLLAILFTEFQVIGTLSHTYPSHIVEFKGLMNVVASFDGLPCLIIGLWVYTACLYLLAYRLPENHALRSGSNVGRWIWLGLILLVCTGVIYVLYDVNIASNVEKYGPLNQYLFLDDN